MYNPIISCRLNRKTYKEITLKAEITHEKKSKIIQHILDGLSWSSLSAINDGRTTVLEILAKLSTLVQAEINQRKRIGNNVNQITEHVNEARKRGKPVDISSLNLVHLDLKKLAGHDGNVDKEVSHLWRILE